MFFCWGGGGKIILLKNLNKYKIIPCINNNYNYRVPFLHITPPPPFHMFDAIHVVTQIRLKLIS